MLAALEAHFPPRVRWTRPAGGLFLWCTLPDGLSSAEVLGQAIQRKVAFVPGASFHPTGGGDGTFRLNFSYCTPEIIGRGIERLGQVLHGMAR
jgi:2-aminoadipate transaminase